MELSSRQRHIAPLVAGSSVLVMLRGMDPDSCGISSLGVISPRIALQQAIQANSIAFNEANLTPASSFVNEFANLANRGLRRHRTVSPPEPLLGMPARR
jgi:hypothetical protein